MPGSSVPDLTAPTYGTHSVQRTRSAQIYKEDGKSERVQLRPGHIKLESTVHYFGIEVEDALSISPQVEL
jgi:hypothetical protein